MEKQRYTQPEVILVIMPWDLPSSFTHDISAVSPGIEIINHRLADHERYDQEIPAAISQDVLDRVTVLFTWNAIPAKEKVPRLEYVQLLSAGCNHVIGKPVFDETEIAFCTANGVHPPQIAEWVIATFLSFKHYLYQYWDHQKTGTWVMPQSDEDTEDAVGVRMGVLGYGTIGRQCARVGKALGMDVHAFTLHERATPESRHDTSFTEPGLGDPAGELPSRWFHGKEQLDDFLASVDLLVITLPLTKLTTGLISHHEMKVLGKRKAFLSNIARGPVVDTDALVEALNNGTLSGAALDVTDPEPLPREHPLWKAKNVVITPHVSGNSTHYNERVLKILKENLRRRAAGLDVINKVNKSLGY